MACGLPHYLVLLGEHERRHILADPPPQLYAERYGRHAAMPLLPARAIFEWVHRDIYAEASDSA